MKKFNLRNLYDFIFYIRKKEKEEKKLFDITHQVLYPGKFRDRFLDGRFEVAILQIQSILPATYFRRRIRFLQHLCKILTSSSSRTFTRQERAIPAKL